MRQNKKDVNVLLMLKLFIFIIPNVILYFWLRKKFKKSFHKAENRFKEIKEAHNVLLEKNKAIQKSNVVLNKMADQTMALYDITKEICKYLDEEKVFLCFKEQLNKYISVKDCRFLKTDADISKLTGFEIMPFRLSQDTSPIGYLAYTGISEEEKDEFHILASQLSLGIKRAFLYKQVQELAITDSLTGVLTRRYYLERLNEELERSKKYNYYFSLLMIDIDNFKDYNDRFGHLVGDTILKELSQTIKENVRQIDLLGRYGGEEFSIVLTETNKDEAVFAAQRIREAAENRIIKAYDENLKVTVSIGLAIFPTDATDPEQLIEKADQALYQAKETGKNKVLVYNKK